MLKGYCGYSISDQYSAPTRFFFYGMVLLGLFGARIKYRSLVSTALSAVLLFSIVTTIHTCLVSIKNISSEYDNGGHIALDFDIIPGMTITTVAAILAGPIFTASKTLRRSVHSSFRIVFAVSFLPALFCITMWGSIPAPVDCDLSTGVCGNRQCHGDGNGRDQQVIIFPTLSKTLFIVLSILMLSPTITSFVLLVEFLPAKWYEKFHKNSRLQTFRYGIYILNLIIATFMIAIAEYALCGPDAIPFNESFTSIGIWGPVSVTLMALVSAAYSDFRDGAYEERLVLPYTTMSVQTFDDWDEYSEDEDLEKKRMRLGVVEAVPVRYSGERIDRRSIVITVEEVKPEVRLPAPSTNASPLGC